jgi:glycosyltransferase involved in cell wall biosynthesis
MNRLLVDLTPALGEHGVRGIGRYVRGLSTALEAVDDPLTERVVTMGLEVTGLRSVGSRSLVEAWRPQDVGWLTGWIADSLANRSSGGPAFHATDPRKALRPFGARLVATVYDLIPVLDREVGGRVRPHRRLIHRLYLASVRRAARVIAISKSTAVDVAQYLGVPEERIDVVYPVVQGAVGPISGPESSSEPIFVAVGVPDPHKQPELAIRSLATFRARAGVGRLRFIGHAPAGHVAPLLEVADQLGVRFAIEFAGSVPDADLEVAYATARAVLALSRREGFGLPAVEAAIRRVPVVAVDTSVARETLGGAATFVPSEVASIVDAMEAAIRPSPAAVAALVERYRPETVGASLLRSYRAILDG